ncbi:hypothetical protein ANANG_G00115280 [Anguilla anguilla]|uniref:Uncharacterized protein n=1 Tax=Anguilla anguilla TaxID=7936 RepID=A0A9D3MFB9_ANGAN|nr:hypothetical protein ANANG_G00115280 [Anguilla anguilla]
MTSTWTLTQRRSLGSSERTPPPLHIAIVTQIHPLTWSATHLQEDSGGASEPETITAEMQEPFFWHFKFTPFRGRPFLHFSL